MRIIDRSKGGGLSPVVHLSGYADIAAEHRMDIFLQEKLAMRVTCTPEHLEELVLGRLLTEGLIRHAEDVREIFICEQGLRARVFLSAEADVPFAENEAAEVSTCCTDNRTLLTGRTADIPPVQPRPWDAQWLRRLAERMREGAPYYTQTHAMHACYLARGDELLCCREDIGRHNALDKVIGWALLHGIDLGGCLLFTTGRLPTDMVLKAVRSGVPLLASKTYPTDQGIAAARQARLTLVTLRGRDEMIVWTDGGADAGGAPAEAAKNAAKGGKQP